MCDFAHFLKHEIKRNFKVFFKIGCKNFANCEDCFTFAVVKMLANEDSE